MTIDIKHIQHLELEILRYFVSECNRIGVKYFLIYGTLLGAIRHSGFIPWDDDIDVVMPRDDYERFLECFKENNDIILHTAKVDKHYFAPFARLRLKNTTFIPVVYKENRFCNNGIWIDIFPIDLSGSPDCIKEIIKYSAIRLLEKLAEYKEIGRRGDKRSVNSIIDFFCKLIPLRISMGLIDCLLKFNTGNDYYVSYCSPYGKKKNYFKSELFKPYHTAFEDVDCVVPEGYDTVLRVLYGNYHVFPDEKNRYGHKWYYIDYSQYEK